MSFRRGCFVFFTAYFTAFFTVAQGGPVQPRRPVALPGIGVTVKGARRWINLGLANFQAVEAVKLTLLEKKGGSE